MAQNTTDYRGSYGEGSNALLFAEMGAYMGSSFLSGMEKSTFNKLGTWKGSARATHAYYTSLRSGLWGRYSGGVHRPGRYSSMIGGIRQTASVAPKMAASARYGSALELLERPGGRLFSKKIISEAGKRGISKEFAKLAISRIGRTLLTGLEVSMWGATAFQGFMGAVTTLRTIGRKGLRQEFGESFIDNRSTYTERQRSIRAITSSRLSARSAIGGEAQLMHR